MVLTTDKERLKNLLIETITLLCKNGLDFQSEFSVDALIGITLDQKDVFLVTIKETVKSVISNELGKEPFSHASLHSDTPDADFHENNHHHQKSLNCQIGLDVVSAARDDNFGSKLVPESLSEGRNGPSCVGKTFCASIMHSTSDNCLPVVNIGSPLSDDDICILENIIPSISSQKGCTVVDSLQLEPPRKRQREISSQKKYDNSNAISQEAVIQDLILPCKLEPLEDIKLENSPVVSEHFGTQDNHNFLYDTAYGNEVNATLDPMFLNWYSQPSPVDPPAVPGCSSWLNSSMLASRGLHNCVSIM